MLTIRLVAAFFLLTAFAQAEVNLCHIFGNDMVLQRDMPVPVWGTAAADESITVSFAGQTKTTVADKDGKWMVKLDAMPANKQPGELKVNDRVIKNVLVGEVWICSGQSNMEWSVNAVKKVEEEKAAADFPLIRHIKVPKRPSDRLETDFNASWQVCTPGSVGSFTAVGYFFARELHQKVDVPIGLINSSWGGTKIEPWMPRGGFERIKEQSFATGILKRLDEGDPNTEVGKKKYLDGIAQIKTWADQAEKEVQAGNIPATLPNLPTLNRSHQDPTRLYKGMIHPLVPFAFRGAIWYQGESNGGEGASYTHKMDGLINGWRTVWNQGDFPFYYVQLANFHQDNEDAKGGDGFAKIREAQTAALDLKNTGMAVIIDIGEATDIHPRNKQDVGSRLAQWALKNDYGKEVTPSGPKYKSHSIADGKIRVQFDFVGKGLIVGEKDELEPVAENIDGKLKRFALAGKDNNWFWADATIDGDSVVVSSKMVDMPVHVRYAYAANPVGANLYNRDGLPAVPFRTDK